LDHGLGENLHGRRAAVQGNKENLMPAGKKESTQYNDYEYDVHELFIFNNHVAF